MGWRAVSGRDAHRWALGKYVPRVWSMAMRLEGGNKNSIITFRLTRGSGLQRKVFQDDGPQRSSPLSALAIKQQQPRRIVLPLPLPLLRFCHTHAMRVLVFGASGHIGLPVAQALVRAGHEVIGQSRSASNNVLFAREESESKDDVGG